MRNKRKSKVLRTRLVTTIILGIGLLLLYTNISYSNASGDAGAVQDGDQISNDDDNGVQTSESVTLPEEAQAETATYSDSDNKEISTADTLTYSEEMDKLKGKISNLQKYGLYVLGGLFFLCIIMLGIIIHLCLTIKDIKDTLADEEPDIFTEIENKFRKEAQSREVDYEMKIEIDPENMGSILKKNESEMISNKGKTSKKTRKNELAPEKIPDMIPDKIPVKNDNLVNKNSYRSTGFQNESIKHIELDFINLD